MEKVYILQLSVKEEENQYSSIVGVYSNKELAHEAYRKNKEELICKYNESKAQENLTHCGIELYIELNNASVDLFLGEHTVK